MYAKYIGETIYVGPDQIELIKHGEIRKIHAKGTDGRYILSGRDGKGFFGWVNPDKIELV